MKRVAIVLPKTLNPGEVGNVSAILMGQLSVLEPNIFETGSIEDTEGNQHAAIRFSTIVLKAKSTTQIVNFASSLASGYPSIQSVVFTQIGQSFNNRPLEYRESIQSKTLAESEPVGIALFGDEDDVIKATKKFSVLQ